MHVMWSPLYLRRTPIEFEEGLGEEEKEAVVETVSSWITQLW